MHKTTSTKAAILKKYINLALDGQSLSNIKNYVQIPVTCLSTWLCSPLSVTFISCKTRAESSASSTSCDSTLHIRNKSKHATILYVENKSNQNNNKA